MNQSRGAIVTGGGGALGLAIATRLGEHGPVGIVDISQSAVDSAIDSLRSAGITAEGVAVDVSDESEAVGALETLGAAIRPRVLVTTAGYADYVDPLELSAARFSKMLGVHLLGTFIAARTLHPYLAQGDGRIIAIGSIAAHQGSPLQVHYASAKAGIEGLIRSLASSWAAEGIRSNILVPGTIRTPMFESMPEAVRDNFTAGGRRPVGVPNDIAAAVEYFADPLSGDYLNGATLHIDGGARLALRPI